MATISGVITAMVTPFDEGGRLDTDSARRLAGHLGENGSHGLVIAGTTGESPTLSDAEKLDLQRAREIDSSLQGVYEAMTVTTNPIPVKAGAEMLGLIGGRMRLPMVEADEEQRAVVRAALERQGLLATSPG